MALDRNTWTLKTQGGGERRSWTSAKGTVQPGGHPPTTSSPRSSARTTEWCCRSSASWAWPPSSLRNRADEAVAALPTAYGTDTRIGKELHAPVRGGRLRRAELTDDYLSTEHVLLAMVEPRPGRAPSGTAASRAWHRVTPCWPRSPRCAAPSASPARTPRSTYQALEKYGRDLTEAARAGKLDPVIGRDEEIRRVIQVLAAAPRTTRC